MLKMDSGSENIQLSAEEAHMLQNAFQKEEFRKMFAEYIEEINDPNNIAKYEDEMTILEKERGYDITFLKPEAGYVMKLLEGGKKSFVNICKNVNVGMAACKNALGRNKKMGCSWDIPMMFSKPRNMLDKKGSPCTVYDVMFNPNAFDVAKRVKGFRKIMEDSALTYVEKNFSVVFDRSNIKYPRMKYKGIPSRCVLRKKTKHSGSDDSINDEWCEMLARKSCDSVTSAEVLPNKLGALDENHSNQSQFVAPKYVIKYREYADMSKYLSGCGFNKKEIVIDIDVPLAHTAAELELDISEKHAFIQSVVPAHNYRVEINFPYQVKDTDGKAEFDPKSKKLILTLPVIQHIEDDLCIIKSTEPCSKSSEVEHHVRSVASTQVPAECSNECIATEEQVDSCKDCEMHANCSTLDENLHEETSFISDIEGPVGHDEKQNCNTSDFTRLQAEHAGEVGINTESGLFFRKCSRCIVRSSNCSAREFCEFPLLCTSGVQASDASCEGHESHSDIILKFQVERVCPNSVNILFCPCSSSMEISYELLGSGCLPLKCAHRLSFGSNKKVWQNKISVYITQEDLSVEIKKQEECCFYWEKYWFGSHNKPIEALHFSRKLQSVVGKSVFVCDVEETDTEYKENDHHAESLDYCVPSQTSGAHANHDSDQNALNPHNYSNEVIVSSCESHSVEKQCHSSAEEDVSCHSLQFMKSPVPQAAVETVAPVPSPQQNAALKSMDCIDITSHESKVCEGLENCSVVYPGNDTGVSEITEKLKSTVTRDIRTEVNFTGCTPFKDTDSPGYQESLNFKHSKKVTCCESSETLEVVSSSLPCEEILSERQKDNAVKLVEEICDGFTDMGNDEKVAETSSSDKINSCNITEVNGSHNSISLVAENENFVHNRKVTYCESSETLEVMSSSSPCEEIVSERKENNAVKLIEEICDSSTDTGNDEKVAEASSNCKINRCNITVVNDSHDSTSLAEGSDMVNVSQELFDTLYLHHVNSPENIVQLSELHSFNDATNYCEAQTDGMSFAGNLKKSNDTVDLSTVSVVPDSKVFDNKESTKRASEDIMKESLNSDDDESCDNVGQPSTFWGPEHNTSYVLSSAKTRKIGALFKNTIMFELD